MTLQTNRATAGARYVAAVTEIRSAIVDLAAHDELVGVMNGGHVPGFALPIMSIVGYHHGTYLPDPKGNWGDDVRARIAEIAP
jgi:hypothetical protein